MKHRFSKKILLIELQADRDRLEKEHGFIEKDGWNQVTGKGEYINRMYGQYNFILHLITELD